MTHAIFLAFTWMQALLAPALAIGISALYFTASPKTEPLAKKLLVSAHGVVIALLYLGAMSVFWLHRSSDAFAKPFSYVLLIPLLLILTSLFMFRGRKLIHWLLLVNLACLAWTAFIGVMAVTGDWL
jgi:hypothetical protein